MEKKCLGPNIGTWSTRIHHGEYVKHADGCNGLMLQIVTSSKTLSPKGKPYCDKCNKVMGRKAYRKILKLLQDNHINLEHYIGDRGSNRIFFRSVRTDDYPEEYPKPYHEPPVPDYNIQRPAPLDSSLSAVETYKAKRFTAAYSGRKSDMSSSTSPGGPHYTFTHGSLAMRVPYDELTVNAARRLSEEISRIPKQFDGAASMQHLLEVAIRQAKREREADAPDNLLLLTKNGLSRSIPSQDLLHEHREELIDKVSTISPLCNSYETARRMNKFVEEALQKSESKRDIIARRIRLKLMGIIKEHDAEGYDPDQDDAF